VEPIISDTTGPLKGRFGTILAVVAVIAVLGLVAWGALALLGGSGDDDDDTGLEATPTTRSTPATESQTDRGQPTSTTAAAAEPELPIPPDLLLSDPTPAIQALGAAIGAPYRAREIDLYAGYAILEYQDPTAPTHVDTRTWRDGAVEDPRPVSLPSGFDAEVEAELFDPAEVRFDLVPSLVAQAIGQFPTLEHAVASHIIIDRFRPFDERVNIRVYVSDPDRGGGGYVRFLGDGTFVQTVG
jgi:hypothetical protein